MVPLFAWLHPEFEPSRFQQVEALLMSAGIGGKTLLCSAVSSGSKELFEVVLAALPSGEVCCPLKASRSLAYRVFILPS